MVHVEFSTIQSFRHPLVVLEWIPLREGALLHDILCQKVLTKCLVNHRLCSMQPDRIGVGEGGRAQNGGTVYIGKEYLSNHGQL